MKNLYLSLCSAAALSTLMLCGCDEKQETKQPQNLRAPQRQTSTTNANVAAKEIDTKTAASANTNTGKSSLLKNFGDTKKTVKKVKSIKSTVLLSDDFEKDNSPFLEKLGKSAKVYIVEGKDAIDGKKSLCIDSLDSGMEWVVGAELSQNIKLKDGKAYMAAFDYHLVECKNQSASNFISIVDSKKKFYGRSIFASAPGQKGSAKFFFILPKGAEKSWFRFSSQGESKTIIDNLKIEQIDIDADSWIFKEDAFIGMRKTPTHPNMLDLKNPSVRLPKEKYFPMLDEFGQFKYTNWESKVGSLQELKDSIKKEEEYNASRPDIQNRDIFGGLANSSNGAQKTNGFTTAKVDGKWYLRTPEGNLFWSMGITGVGEFSETPLDDREFYFTNIDPKYVRDGKGYKPGTYYNGRKIKIYQLGKKNVELKYGINANTDYWKIAAVRMKKWGLNTFAAWSNQNVMTSETVPFTVIFGSSGAKPLETQKKLYVLWGNIPDYFAPSFQKLTEKLIFETKKPIHSKFCIGAFVDNEISWQVKLGNTALAVLSCPAKQPAKIEMQNMLQQKYGDITKLNAVWKSNYTSWQDFLSKTNFEPKLEDAKADLYEFERIFSEHYFKVCRDAVKKVNPEALYLGCRFSSRNEIVERAAFKYCDVVSYNIYRTDTYKFTPPSNSIDKPVMVGEFHICRTDKGSPYGGLLEVSNAKRAAEAYKHYMTSAIKHPNIVGVHWFEWSDMFITGRPDGANATCGFVSITDIPDYEMTDAAREISSSLFDIRAKK